MRVLSALVLTHCFGCVIPEDSDDEFTVRKSNLSKMKDNSNPVNIRAENPQDPCDVMRIQHFLSEPMKSTERYKKYSRSNSSDDEQSLQGNIDLLSDHEKIADSQNKQLIRHRRRIHRSRHNRLGFHRGFRKSNRKNTLNYYAKGSHDEDIKNENVKNDEPREQHPINRYPYETKEMEMRQEDEGFQEDPEGWDNWSNWSKCSVTCGYGRQVRWRHCSAENCPRGLKMAQMKTCHLSDCSKKSFLKWLGIKL